MRRGWTVAGVLLLAALPGDASAQQAATVPVAPPSGETQIVVPILTVDQDALFKGSLWGKRAQAEIDREGQALQDENDRLAAELSAEEAALTERRPTMDAAEFRQKAEAFDLRATTVRRERAKAVADLNARAEADQNAFYQAALPIMGEVMQARGASAILDRRTVFVAADAIDITADLVTRLDSELGDGAGQPSPTGNTPAPDENAETGAPDPAPNVTPPSAPTPVPGSD